MNDLVEDWAKPPKSLHDLCLEPCSILVSNACSKLYMEYEDFEDGGCQEAIQSLQDLLLQTLPFRLFETLAEHRGNRVNSLLGGLRLGRITVSLFLHPKLTRLEVRPNESVSGFIKDSDLISDAFWIGQFRKLVNLTDLDIGQLATDEILEAVGLSCIKLQTISFLPQIAVNHVGGFERFSVTGKGLMYLLPCKHLRRVSVGYGVIDQRHQSAELRKFILSLPVLEDIDVVYMGSILHGKGRRRLGAIKKPTRLKVFREFNPFNIHVSEIESACPELKQLIINIDSDVEWRWDSIDIYRQCSSVMERLSTSKLEIETLNVSKYPLSEGWQNLFTLKGKYLTRLKIERRHANLQNLRHLENDMDTSKFEIIARHCSNLKVLEIGGEARTGLPQRFILNLAKIRQHQYLKNLRMLKLKGIWQLGDIIPLALMCATKIQTVHIDIWNRCHIAPGLNPVMDHNALNELTFFSASKPVVTSADVARRFIAHCPVLRHAEMDMDTMKTNHIEQAKLVVDEAKHLNRNLRFDSFVLRNHERRNS